MSVTPLLKLKPIAQKRFFWYNILPHAAKFSIMSVVMLSVIMLNVANRPCILSDIILNVVMLIVEAPTAISTKFKQSKILKWLAKILLRLYWTPPIDPLR